MIAHLFLAASLLATAPARDAMHDEPDPMGTAPLVVLAEIVDVEPMSEGGAIVSADVVQLVRGLAGTRVSFDVRDAVSAPEEGRKYLLFLEQDRVSLRHLPVGRESWIAVEGDQLSSAAPSPGLDSITGTSVEEAVAQITALSRKPKEPVVEPATGPCAPTPPGCNAAPCINQGWWEIGFEGTMEMPITITDLSTGATQSKTGMDVGQGWKLYNTQGGCANYSPKFFIDNNTSNDCHIPESAQAVLTFNTVTYRIQFGSLGKVLFRGSTTQCSGGGLDALYKVSSTGVAWRWGSQNHQIWGWPDACVSAADCDDGLFCTQDVCTNGVCSHPPTQCTSPEPYCYSASCDEGADECALSPTPNFDVPYQCGNHWCVCF